MELESICGEQCGVRWPWITRLRREQELVAEARVDLVMLNGAGRVLRRPPSELEGVMQRLLVGPGDEPSN